MKNKINAEMRDHIQERNDQTVSHSHIQFTLEGKDKVIQPGRMAGYGVTTLAEIPIILLIFI